jgi:hypothetical protein
VLQCETGSTGGGDGRWFKRSTGEEWPVARDNVIITIKIIIITTTAHCHTVLTV